MPIAKYMTDEQAEAIAAIANCCGGIAYSIYVDLLDASPEHNDAQPVPLTDEQIEIIAVDLMGTFHVDDNMFARAIEAAHGIGGADV